MIIPSVPDTIPRIMIPKVMHRVWLSGEPLPRLAQEYIDGWTRLHPDWQQRLWTSENLPEMFNRPLFDRAQGWAAKTDILRYELMHQFGGVYLDVDVEPRKNIDALIAGLDAFAPRFREESSPGFDPDFCLEIAVLGSVPRHALFGRIVDALGPWNEAHVGQSILLTTGPQFFTLQVRKWNRGDTQGHTLTELPPPAFQPYEWDQFDREAMDHPDSYGIHRCWGSWNNRNGRPPKT